MRMCDRLTALVSLDASLVMLHGSVELRTMSTADNRVKL